MRVTVVGLGKIGLPLAVQFAGHGCQVTGADISTAVVEAVSAGLSPFPNEPGLNDQLKIAVEAGSLVATVDTAEAVGRSEVVIVAVPVVVDSLGQPDFTMMDGAAAEIGRGLHPGTLVIIETTLPVGTTRRRLGPLLEVHSGLQVGRDFSLCYSPERVMSGSVFADLRRYPKLIGGLDDESARRAQEFYEKVLQFEHRPDLVAPNGVWDLGSPEAAELTKLAETTYRDVNIALANEFARYADRINVDVRRVIEGANSQPYSHIHRPGVAVGGHCIPVYPLLYLAGDPGAKLPDAGRRANTAMPTYTIDVLCELLGDLTGVTVVILGVSYRGGVKETAFSGAFPLAQELRRRGARCVAHDPLYTERELTSLGFEVYQSGSRCDAAILQADHADYLAFTPAELPGVRAIVDGRDVLDPVRWPGIPVKSLGRPARTFRETPA